MLTGVKEKVFMSIVLRMLPYILDKTSSPIREALVKFIQELESRAKETENVFDDFLVDLIKAMFNID